jgi:hypothetical protein
MFDQENVDNTAKEQELAKQLSSYADGFTAFSFVQGATFCFLVAQNAAVACELRLHWVVAEGCLAIAGACYFLLLNLCKQGEDKLLIPAARGEKIMGVVRMVRRIRLWIVGVATIGEILLIIAAHFAPPFFDCSKLRLP